MSTHVTAECSRMASSKATSSSYEVLMSQPDAHLQMLIHRPLTGGFMKAITDSRPIEILLVEDSATDVMLAEEALEEAKMRNNLHVVKDGVEALAFLRKEGKYADVPRPDLMLLDLNMPRKDGREVLAEVKADDELKQIPVVVLTTSQAQEDVLKAYGLHANCYISKPVDFEQFANVVRAIDQFWFTVVTLPTGDSDG